MQGQDFGANADLVFDFTMRGVLGIHRSKTFAIFFQNIRTCQMPFCISFEFRVSRLEFRVSSFETLEEFF